MKITIFLLIISNYLVIAQIKFDETINIENNEEEMKRRIYNLLNEQQKQQAIKNVVADAATVIKVQQSPNVGENILGSPTSLLCPPCALPTFKCLEPQPMVLPINCPLPQRPIIPPSPRISCPPPTVCPPPQPCPAPLTCPRPAPCPLPPPPPRRPPPPMSFPPQIICPPRGNILATISAQNDCCCNCGIRSCLILPSSTRMQKRHFLATLGARTHFGGNDSPLDIFSNMVGDTIAGFMNENAKCNSELLRKIILEVCGSEEFTFIVHATQYCQAGNVNENGTCYAFSFN
uniref:Ground-like domain-containing protein n=1 Tax=Meloidogyne hapla TaxID=6305 RepID=A0A1I8C0D3_MELHA